MIPSFAPRFAVLAALAAIAACGPARPATQSDPQPSGSPPRTTAIEGVVRSPDGDAVAGAHVAINTPGGDKAVARARSGPDGRFRAAVPPGSYALTATAPGHAAALAGVASFEVAGRRSPVVLRLGPGGSTVRGTVAYPDGSPAGAVAVRIYRVGDDPGAVFYTTADERGRYQITLDHIGQGCMIFVEDDGLFLPEWAWVAEAGDQTFDLTVHSRAPASPAVVRWIADNAAPLRAVTAGSGFADMDAIAPMIGDARVVGLGEATHGTREFFQLKHRLFEYMVERMGFTVFAIEADFSAALAIDDYVTRGEGDPAEALAGLGMWPWNTEEVLALVEWMRRYNADPAHRSKLSFYGYDMQGAGLGSRHAAAYLAILDPAAGEALTAAVAPLTADDVYRSYPDRDPAERQAVRDAIAAAVAHLDRDRDRYVARTGEDAFAIARQNLVAVGQAEEFIASPDRSFEIRDRYMAANIEWILDHERPGTRVVAWAGNGHVQTTRVLGSDTMGKHLRRSLGGDYVTFGFTFHRGSFQARYQPPDAPQVMELQEITVGPAPAGNVGETFARAGIPVLALDLRRRPRTRPAHPATAWLEAPHLMRLIGASFRNDGAAMHPHRLTESFDVMLFVRETTRARPLDTVLPAR